ncbi:hypothetical protein TSUD_369020, partial [Trifolium subterraneum]
MAFEIPVDQINQLQILLRKNANLSWYQPEKEENLPLPKLSSVSETVAKLDPSPPYLRCKNCNGRLLRGVQSFICVFCGSNPHKDLPPEPIKFKNTLGYRWLLESLQLDGSEMVAPMVDEHTSNRARSELKDEIPLSELLDLEIRWPSEAERTSNSDTEAFPGESSLSLSGVDLDSFFDRKESDSNVSGQNLASERNVGAASDNTFQGNENLSLFQNVQASEASGGFAEDQSGDSFSGWEANFKFASSGPVHESKSVDHSKVELDTVSGYRKDSVGVTKNDDFNPSASDDDWFQGDGFKTSNSVIDGQSGKMDWMQDDQWKGIGTKIPDIGVTDEEDDSWNAFTGSASAQDPSDLSDTKTAEGGNSSSNRDFGSDKASFSFDKFGSDKASFSFDSWNISNSEITGETGKFETTEDPNDTKIALASSSNVDWMQNDPWQESTNKASGIMTTNEVADSFDAWNDFTGSAISQNPSSSVSHSEIKDQTGISEITVDLHGTKTAESTNASTVKSFDWMQDDQWQVSNNKTNATVTTNGNADSFDVWSDFTSLTTRQEDPFSNVPLQTANQTPSENTFEMGLFESSNNSHDMNFSGFSQHDLFGQFDNPLSTPTTTNAQPAAASLNRVADEDTMRQNVSTAEVGSKDDVE